MNRKMAWVWLAAAVSVGVLGVFLATQAGAQTGKAKLDYGMAPNVYGEGILFAFSGIDGRTSYTSPCVASSLGDGVGLRLHLPKDPVIRVRLPAPGVEALKWRLVANDVMVADVAWDAQPLVIAFLAPNVIVGRVPQSCRVSFDGGDSSVVLLRNDVDGRTQFAFAYDPTGGALAREIANSASHAALETLIETRLDFFKNLPPAPDGIEKIRARAFGKAFSVLKVNEYGPEPSIAGQWPSPARWPLRDIWLQQTAFQSLGLMHMDVRLAKESLLTVYTFQAESGMIPNHMAPGQTTEISNPPILAWAAWQVYQFDKERDRQFLEKSFDAAQRHVTWFMTKRRLDGEPPPNKPMEHGTPLYFWQSAEESGAETSPRFEGGAAFAAVDLSCYLANECWTLQTMAQRLGYAELAKRWGIRGDAIAEAARKELWDNERGFYFDRKGPGGEWIDVWTYAGLLPLWSGIATPDQAARIKNHLLSKKFWTAMPVPTVARDDKAYKADIGRGPAAAHVNYLVIRGLQRFGYAKEDSDLREKTIAAIANWYGKTGVLFEYYDCDGETSPRELARTGSAAGSVASPITDYNPTAALYIDLLIRPKP